ncbi:MAG: adenylyl-sulfate kinase [Bacteroidota bacterium]
MQNIHPIFEKTLNRSHKEALLEQKAVVVWMVGLSGSGKSTLATALENDLHQRGFLTQLLDGDNLRSGINNNLGFTEADREENIRRSAEVAKLFLNCGVVTICSFISPTEAIRQTASQIIGEANFLEIFVECPVEECEKRDVKGLYAKARRGEIKNFTGIDAPFESPKQPALVLPTHLKSLEECSELLSDTVLKRIKVA